MAPYDHSSIEKKWQDFWATNKIYTTPDQVPGKENFYLLVEFPYPSGNLHVGHWYAFAVPDILARFMRMQGKNVMYPIGFDAFGLPAENAAIKNKLNPRDWTQQNIAYMTKQIESMGTSFDWSRKVSTIDPEYYKWTQWLFLQLYKKGLVYQKETAVNWCPNDKTVLANEQVVDGKCERCGHEVVQKQMVQWNIKITEYADRLIDDLANLDWPEQIKDSQRNWIGRSEGAEIDFYLDFGDEAINARTDAEGKRARITVFTTRPDTLFGATYLVLAPEHPWVKLALGHKTVLKNNDAVQQYVDQASRKTELERQTDQKEKTGVLLEGVVAINPATKEKIPMYVADYVLGHYGTGAIMAVPAHDERDYEFAKKFNLPIKTVIIPRTVDAGNPHREGKEIVFRQAIVGIVRNPQTGQYLTLKWKEQPWTTFITGGVEDGEKPEDAARREITEETGYTNLKLVRVLGAPIQAEFYAAHKDINRVARVTAVLFDLENDERNEVAAEELAKHHIAWVDRKDITPEKMRYAELPIILPRIETGSDVYSGDGIIVDSDEFDGLDIELGKKAITETYGRLKKTYRLRDWIVSRQRYWGVPIPMIHCEKCGAQPVPEDQLPVELPPVEDYLPSGEGKSPLAKVESFVHTTCPKCGGEAKRETDTLDTFVDSSWYFLRYTDPKNSSQFAESGKQKQWMPVDLYSGGAEHTTMHLLYSRFWHKALYDCGLVADPEPYARRMNRSLIMGPDGQKMSKSRGNVIDPDEVVAKLGADTVRMYLAFIGPYNEVASYPWNPDSVVGVRRFIERVWKLQDKRTDTAHADIEKALHKLIKKVGDDVPLLKFNTAIAAMMAFLNDAEKLGVTSEQYKLFVRVLAPFAPHTAEELWQTVLGEKESIHLQEWPVFDASKIVDDTVVIGIQINGKTRGEVSVPADADKDATEAAAKAAVAARLEGKEIMRAVVVPKRLVNFVIKD